MTYAPDDLQVVRRYVLSKTNLDANSVGIAGDKGHASDGGYHEGNDDLASVGKLSSDYSKRESPRDRPGSNAASALDIGNFDHNGRNLRALSQFIVNKCKGGDTRCKDIREVIYTPNGVNVSRWDRLGIRATGDSSHLYHTHLSFFRDSEGRRALPNNILGLLTEYFEGVSTMTTLDGVQGEQLNNLERLRQVMQSGDPVIKQVYVWDAAGGSHVDQPFQLNKTLAIIDDKLDEILARPANDLAAIKAAVADAVSAEVADLANKIIAALGAKLSSQA